MPIMKEKYSVSQSILYKTNSHLRIIIHTINCIAKDVHTFQNKRESYLLSQNRFSISLFNLFNQTTLIAHLYTYSQTGLDIQKFSDYHVLFHSDHTVDESISSILYY